MSEDAFLDLVEWYQQQTGLRGVGSLPRVTKIAKQLKFWRLSKERAKLELHSDPLWQMRDGRSELEQLAVPIGRSSSKPPYGTYFLVPLIAPASAAKESA